MSPPHAARLGAGELELELIQFQMAQKPMLRGEVGARAWRGIDTRCELELELVQSQMAQKPMLRNTSERSKER